MHSVVFGYAMALHAMQCEFGLHFCLEYLGNVLNVKVM